MKNNWWLIDLEKNNSRKFADGPFKTRKEAEKYIIECILSLLGSWELDQIDDEFSSGYMIVREVERVKPIPRVKANVSIRKIRGGE